MVQETGPTYVVCRHQRWITLECDYPKSIITMSLGVVTEFSFPLNRRNVTSNGLVEFLSFFLSFSRSIAQQGEQKGGGGGNSLPVCVYIYIYIKYGLGICLIYQTSILQGE